MAGDMVVALGSATVDGCTLFAHNSSQPARQYQVLKRIPGRSFSAGEKIRTALLEIPQVKQTHTFVGSQPAGSWGCSHGVNEHGLAVGCTQFRTKLRCQGQFLLDTELVRLVLERARTACQAIDVLTDLVERFGQGLAPQAGEGDSSFLLADPGEAHVIQTAGKHWVSQQVQETRAVSDGSTIRQDWDRIARGLASHAIAEEWWPGDGSKLDFTGAVGEASPAPSSLQRWGRATLLIEQQSGHIEPVFLRRLLTDHYEGQPGEVDPFHDLSPRGSIPLCQHGGSAGLVTTASLIAQLGNQPERPTLMWWSFGPPCISVYLPIFLEGELPEALTASEPAAAANGFCLRMARLHDQLRLDPSRKNRVCQTLDHLQAKFDQETEEFIHELASLKKEAAADLDRKANQFMQHTLEQYTEVLRGLAWETPVLAGRAPV